MKIVKIAREKLVEKDIEWKQVYTDKTLFLKEQFEDIIGPGSYFRFEGQDRGSDSEYYCIIGPAKIHDPIAKFFAGVRKLPATYSAGGKYFDSMDAAASYARDTWGVPTPRSLRPYTATSLRGLKQKVDKWKAQREEAEEKEASDDVYLDKTAAVTNLPSSDTGALRDQMRSKPETQRKVPSEKAQNEIMKEILQDRSREQETELIERYGDDVFEVAKENFEASDLARPTGVGSQMYGDRGLSYLSWDDRTTLSNTSEKRPTVLDLILATDDILAKNPHIIGAEQVKVKQPNGSVTSAWRISVPGRGNTYLPQSAWKGYHNLLEFIKKSVAVEKDPFGEEERGEYEGNTTSILGNPDDEWAALQKDETLGDILDEMGADYRVRNSFNERKKKVFASTIKNLIRIAKNEDDNGNYSNAEEIHKVIRKYKERIK